MQQKCLPVIRLHFANRSAGRRNFFAVLFLLLAVSSCTPVKEYQKNRLNDAEMTLTNRKVEKNELNFQSYREGASGANGGKTGGGCGCN